uniref:Uncharacterized protein LOC111121866 isoform X1 n=1 Tax=Crassostrea virginica TaxID=6565 RepID=A0A8B8CT60_CRAVI|nr:uncharacterized protein LOC111121866 isoform X1 [Crassostrea virginica]
MFRYVFIFSLVFLLVTDEVSAWRRIRKFFKRVGRFAARTAKTAVAVGTAIKAVSAVGKRSVNDEAYQVDICRFDSFDLDADQQITETELSILIDITGLVDLDELFEKLDVNKDDVVTKEEYANSTFIKEACS